MSAQLANETVTLTAAVYNPTRHGHARWEAWAVLDGIDVKVTVYPEDVRWFEDVMKVQAFKKQFGRVAMSETVILRHEKSTGLRVDGAYVNGEYRRIEVFRQVLNAGDDKQKLRALPKEARVEAVLLGRVRSWEILESAVNSATDEAVWNTKARVTRLA